MTAQTPKADFPSRSWDVLLNEDPQTIRARVSYFYDQWLKEEAQRVRVAVIPARPWDTVFERCLAALT